MVFILQPRILEILKSFNEVVLNIKARKWPIALFDGQHIVFRAISCYKALEFEIGFIKRNRPNQIHVIWEE